MANSLNQYSPMQSALALLQPTVSYAQKRQDADRNLMLQGAMQQQSQQQVEMARQQAVLAQQAQAQLMSVPFLERDQQQWVGLMDDMKKKIRSRVENDFGGDIEAYAKTMLEQDIQGLTLDAQKSSLYTGALERRSNFLQAQKDGQEGKIYRPVTYKLTNGQSKTAPFDEAYQDFHNGNTDELPYRGGFKVDGKWQKLITDNYSPRIGQLGKFRSDKATQDELMTALVAGEGLTGEDAAEYLRRTRGLLGNLNYKVDAIDPFEVERTKQGWANVGLRQQQLGINKRALSLKEQAAKNESGQGPLSSWNVTISPQNIITKNRKGLTGSLPVTIYDGEMKPAQKPGFTSLLGFDGSLIINDLMDGMPGVRRVKDKDSDEVGWQTKSLGKAYVTVPNQAGGVDLRETDLSGLNVKIIKGGNIYMDDAPPTAFEQATGRRNRVKVEAVVRISSDEAKSAKMGRLFRGVFDVGQNYNWSYNAFGNADTPTGKGAATYVGERKDADGVTRKYYDVPVLIDRELKAADFERINRKDRGVFSKAGQAGASETLYDSGAPFFSDTNNDDDLNYY